MKASRLLVLSLVLVVLASSLFVANVHAKRSVDVDFSVADLGGTVYLAVWASGTMGSSVSFQIDMWYNVPGDAAGFLPFYSGLLLVTPINGFAFVLVPVGATPGAGAHYFVSVQVYDTSTGELLGFANHDPNGGTNGGMD